MLSKSDKFMQDKKNKRPEFSEKLHRFFEESGVRKVWFAEKIGTKKQIIYQTLQGTHKIPEDCYEKIIELTHGYITLYDLLKEKYRGNASLEVVDGGHPKKCEVRIKGSQ